MVNVIFWNIVEQTCYGILTDLNLHVSDGYYIVLLAFRDISEGLPFHSVLFNCHFMLL